MTPVSLIRIAFSDMLDGYGMGIITCNATRFKSVIALLAAAIVVATAACAGEPPAPTPNIDATIEAGIAATIVGVAIEKGVKATMAPSIAKEHLNRGIAYDELGNYQLAIQVSSASCRAWLC
jgi:hypothetical protein